MAAGNTVLVKANRAIAGMRRGEIRELENTDYVRNAIAGGHLEKVTKAEAKEAGALEETAP